MLTWKKNCYVDWKVCDRTFSLPIWSTVSIRTDNRGWCHDSICGALWIGADSDIKLSWHNLKCFVDWKGCNRKLLRPVWSKMWIRRDDRRWWFELIWGDIWIGTHVMDAALKKLKVLRGLESIL
jgi:hypothetical protein